MPDLSSRFPFGLPKGWFQVAWSTDLEPGDVTTSRRSTWVREPCMTLLSLLEERPGMPDPRQGREQVAALAAAVEAREEHGQ